MSNQITRRNVLQSAGAAGIGFWLAGGASAAPSRSPNERLHIAVVGVGGRGGSTHIGICGKGKASDRQLIAICDCDRRKVAAKAEQMPGVKTYTDFRRMFDELGKDLDAITVATAPDNNHANPALWAMTRGKHVYLEKPMAMTVGECRWLAKVARENKVITQLGNQHHSEYGFRRAAQLIKAGILGKVTEAHCNIESKTSGRVWMDAGELAKLPGRQARLPQGTEPVPDWLDWDAWLGPAKFRPFHPGWMFGGWREFSIASIGNFHNHWVDAPYMALDLKYPVTVEAIGRRTDPLLDAAISVRYTFAARGDQPAVAVYWHGAGTGPTAEMLEGVTRTSTGKQPYQVLFIGEKGRMAAGFGTEPQLLPEATFKDVKLPEPEKGSGGHSELWIKGIRNNTHCECDFHDYAQYLGEGAPLGLVAFWAGGKIDWDGPNMKATNCPEADAWLAREFRKEWKP
ncbi:MAG: Gfo/Idh/MocA family oxidoreductase [Thermoguttaceae bacterium]